MSSRGDRSFKRLTSDTTNEFGVELDQPPGLRISVRRPIGRIATGCILVLVIASISAVDAMNRNRFPIREILVVGVIVSLAVIGLVVRHKRNERWR